MFKDVNLLNNALNASWKRNEVISNNIANANTPNFKKSKVLFEDMLAESLRGRGIQGTLTHKKHYQIGLKPVHQQEYKIQTEGHYSTRRDGNNVDIDVEMAELAKNSILYDTLSTQLNQYLGRLKSAINEGK
ncbi:flagellar basal body rod protein FlgB [Alkaliphilus peptidifermentans]|uniref:Flagellar basal body rod protein FlgB n=1 Tax=Alkaliphilus peptidifermentans DSM 18978 TaxID=1120976 RepID=A0A1G5DJ28_9FIRM|nr:flagellar basal body rod protein FlgB [Alkaliphilus peptidifermentans]SCY14557.1 flagellar basal-body rod protein FlgB [Alkaliphilus peptidifermentans DSM 18978]